MKLNKQLDGVRAICINLKSRKEKKKYMKIQCRRKNIPLKFFVATKHENPKRGCLESHLTVMKEAIADGIKYLLIFEDDVKFKRKVLPLPEVPEDWDMLYLGGTVHRIVNRDNPNWTRVMCWTTHAYIVNLTNQKLVDKIMEADKYDGEIDRFYLEHVHKGFNCYMANPMMAIQKQGFSDIEGQIVNYDFMEKTLEGLLTPEHEEVNGNYVLKLPVIPYNDLPKVSIVTPTYNRKNMFYMALRNFENFNYPSNKLEWIIVDDTPDDMEQLDEILPVDDRIKYLKLQGSEYKLTVSYKRNIGVEKASNDIIIHMDDDDYYPPESILARVKSLVKYKEKGIKCVGCSLIGTYDLVSGKSSMSSDGPISLSEASMAYYKSFWEEKHFDNTADKGEHKHFIAERLSQVLDLPYSFVLIGINHLDNYTGRLRKIDKNVLRSKGTNAEANFYDTWDDETQMFMDSLSSFVKRKKNQSSQVEEISEEPGEVSAMAV
jgi:GR25 family glycosyltransferase involved in LPS biosynthesis